MSNLFLIRLMLLPGFLIQRGPRAYYAGTLAVKLCLLIALAAWLAAPIAIWQAIGFWWMLLWLLPTAVAVFGMALIPLPGGG